MGVRAHPSPSGGGAGGGGNQKPFAALLAWRLGMPHTQPREREQHRCGFRLSRYPATWYNESSVLPYPPNLQALCNGNFSMNRNGAH